MANPNITQIQSAGDLTLTLLHALVNAGAATPLAGFKLEGDIINAEQILDNSKVVPLIGGVAVVITNRVIAGTIRLTCVRTTGDPLQGDIISICHILQALGDNVGGILRAAWGQNGVTKQVSFTGVTVKRCPPLRIQGNDVAPYDVELSYTAFSEN
jgi:hypothetical protein